LQVPFLFILLLKVGGQSLWSFLLGFKR